MGKNSRLISEVLLFIVGLIWFLQQASFRYKNPLDFHFKTGNTEVYFPLGSSIILSILLSLIFYWFKGE